MTDGTDRDRASFSPDTADDLIEAGWRDVADRMDRWAANGYAGDWQDPQYDRAREAEAS